MAKDPAVLFYTADFLTATLTWEDEQVGQYIKLLCLQHQKIRLSEKDMLKICGSHDELIFSKFTKDDNGYFNERLEKEVIRRKKYSESRSNNRKGSANISKSHDEDMVTVTETVTETKTGKENKDLPTFDEFKKYAVENKSTVDLSALHLKYKSWVEAGWKDGNNKKIVNWKSKLLNTLPYLKESEKTYRPY